MSSSDEGGIVVVVVAASFASSSVLDTALCKRQADVENLLTMGEYLCVHAEVLVNTTAHVENRRFMMLVLESRSGGRRMREGGCGREDRATIDLRMFKGYSARFICKGADELYFTKGKDVDPCDDDGSFRGRTSCFSTYRQNRVVCIEEGTNVPACDVSAFGYVTIFVRNCTYVCIYVYVFYVCIDIPFADMRCTYVCT